MFRWLPLVALVGCTLRAAPPAEPTLCDQARQAIAAVAPSARTTSCRLAPGGQVLARTELSIEGSDAEALERYLQDAYGLVPLTFACCGWESQPVPMAVGEDGSMVLVSLHSEETLVHERDGWGAVPFTVVVERLDI